MPRRRPVRIRPFLSRHITPERTFILGFAGCILLGTWLLSFSFSASKGRLGFVDALFTATSAVCVTGLATIDISQDLSIAGQIITILLFQVGGLGIITFSTVFFVLMGRGISFRGREIVQSTFLHTPRVDFLVILKSVLRFTIFFESLGIALLWVRFSRDFSPGKALYLAVYHSISAFNNCGYSLFSDSLVRYQGDLIVNLTVMCLIVIGGIGFIVQYEVFARLRQKQTRLSVHTRIVLIATAFLILFGAAVIYLIETDNVLKGLPLRNQILASFFQSVVPRTAGFNTINIGALANETLLLILILMFIGAAPGSTGGGVKTTSTALLFLLIWSRAKGREEVSVFRRTIPREILSRTIAIIFASGFSIFLITSVLLLTGAGGNVPVSETRHFFVEYLFETVSAFGTVGLSMNLTPKLNDVQKLAIILMMFAGRVGPLTLAFSFAVSGARKTYSYAEEGVMVG